MDGALVIGDQCVVRANPVARAKPARDRHVDSGASGIANAEQGGRGPMAQQSIGTAIEHGGHPNAPLRDPPPPHCIDAAIDGMQPLGLDPPVYGPWAQAQRKQLVPSHHPVLPIGELGKGPIPANAPLFIYFRVNGAFDVHNPIVAAVHRRVGRRA
jgi:hypothetical protein